MLDIFKKLPSYVITIAGQRGTGKTLAAAKFIHHADAGKVLILDLIGAYSQYVNSDDYDLFEVRKPYYSDAYKSALSKGGDKILFNFSGLTRRELVLEVDKILSLLLSSRNMSNLTLVIDEVGEVLPQSHTYYSEETERVIRVGRNRGIKQIILTTQRLQQVDKLAISQSSHYFFFRFLHNLDLDAVRVLLGSSDIGGFLRKLDIGEFYLISYDEVIAKYKYNLNKNKFEIMGGTNTHRFEPNAPTNSGFGKLSIDDKKEIEKQIREGVGLSELSKKYNVSKPCISYYKRKYTQKLKKEKVKGG